MFFSLYPPLSQSCFKTLPPPPLPLSLSLSPLSLSLSLFLSSLLCWRFLCFLPDKQHVTHTLFSYISEFLCARCLCPLPLPFPTSIQNIIRRYLPAGTDQWFARGRGHNSEKFTELRDNFCECNSCRPIPIWSRGARAPLPPHIAPMPLCITFLDKYASSFHALPCNHLNKC